MITKPLFSNDVKNKPLILLGHLSFFILFIFSILFFRERILFSDSAFQFFKLINYEHINIEAHRYGAILPQLPVLLAIKFGAGLKSLTIIYSLSFVLLYYLIFIICTHLLKNIQAGLAVILVLTLCVSQSFYHPVTETHQSLVYTVLLYAILEHKEFRISKIQYVLAIVLIAISFFAHPVALYTSLFIIGYVSIDKNEIRTIKPYILLGVTGSLALGKVLLTNENSYEGQFFSELMKSPSLILNLPKEPGTLFFITRLKSLYLWFVILELILIVDLIYNRKFLKLIWQLAIVSGFLVITFLTYHKGDSTVLMERAFMPLALFVSIPLLKETLAEDKNYFMPKLSILGVVILIGILRLYQQGESFKKRTEFNIELLTKTAQYSNRKFIVQHSKLEKHVTTFWSNSFETLILSTITDGIPPQTIYPSDNPEALTKYTTEAGSVFLGATFWLEWNITDLNQKYFHLPTDVPYKIIDIEDMNLK